MCSATRHDPPLASPPPAWQLPAIQGSATPLNPPQPTPTPHTHPRVQPAVGAHVARCAGALPGGCSGQGLRGRGLRCLQRHAEGAERAVRRGGNKRAKGRIDRMRLVGLVLRTLVGLRVLGQQ